jgi:hypothetical protein
MDSQIQYQIKPSELLNTYNEYINFLQIQNNSELNIQSYEKKNKLKKQIDKISEELQQKSNNIVNKNQILPGFFYY